MEQPPKFMPDKELSKVGGSLWLYIIMQLTLSFLFSFVAMPLIMYSLYYDYSAIKYASSCAITFSIAAFPGAPIVFLISTQVFILIAS